MADSETTRYESWHRHLALWPPSQPHLDLGAADSIGMDFGTFQLTTGHRRPVHALEEACRSRGVSSQRFRTIEFGESVCLR